jgi:hypothetical protein
VLPLGQELLQDDLALAREAVEALPALVLLAPLAGQQPLVLEPAQQRVQRALVDVQPVLGQRLAQRVAVLLGPQRGQHGQHQAAPPQLQPQVLERLGAHGRGTTVCDIVDVT